jgi:DNA-binding transcriptional ArsR family regulator
MLRRPPDDLEPVWKALANPVRRSFLDALRNGPRTTGELAETLPDLSRFAVMQHLGVLEEAGLITVERKGRHRLNYLNPVPIRRIYERWVARYEGAWSAALLSLKEDLERPHEAQAPSARRDRAVTRSRRPRRKPPQPREKHP